jgi:4-amino-4-deoxy-L-arabinose transferase-like glycosyltransferase
MVMRAIRAAALALLALTLLTAHFVNLGADPAPSVPADVLTDEGWWCRNARQRILFGTTPIDEFNQALYAAPVYDALLTASFSVGGLSFASARAVSAAAGLLTLVAVGWLVHALAGRREAVWSVLLLGFSAPYLLHNRTAFVEPFLILLITLTVAATAAGLRNGYWFGLAGVFAALAFWTKPNSLYICALPLLAALFPPSGTPVHRRRSLLLFAGGMAAVSLPLALLVIAPDAREWLATNWLISRAYTGSNWASLPVGILAFPRNRLWGELAPVAALCFGVFLWSIRATARGNGPRWGREILPWLATRWLILAVLTTMAFPYQPIRRTLTLLPPICLLGALALVRLGRSPTATRQVPRPPDPPSPSKRWLLFLLLLWPTASLLWGAIAAGTVYLRGAPPRWALGGNIGYLSAAGILLATVLLASWMSHRCRTAASYEARIDLLSTVAGLYPCWMGLRWILARWGEFSGGSHAALLLADIFAGALIPLVAAWSVGRLARRAARDLPGSRTPGAIDRPSRPGWLTRIAALPIFAALFAIGNVPSLLSLASPSFTMRDAGPRIEGALPRDSVLVGPFADTVGLETGLQTVEVRPHHRMNESPFEKWPLAVLVTAVRHELQLGEHIPPWAPRDTAPVLDLPLCPNPWTGVPRFILRFRAASGSADRLREGGIPRAGGQSNG